MSLKSALKEKLFHFVCSDFKTELESQLKNLKKNLDDESENIKDIHEQLQILRLKAEKTGNIQKQIFDKLNEIDYTLEADNRNITWLKQEAEKIKTPVFRLEENIRNNNTLLQQLVSDSQEIDSKFKILKLKVNAIRERNISEAVPPEQAGANNYDCIDYFDFEDHFRGSREDIKKVQEQYIDYFRGKQNVLDLGSGRGEFLELLNENGIEATGVECYPEFIEFCKERQLPVVEMDAIEYLRKQEHVGGIFAGQLIEHLPVSSVVDLCRLSYEKLEDGAYLVMETPNPMSLAIYTHAFYIDPSHNKPVHPLTVKYFLEKAGFKNIKILFTENSKYPENIPEIQGEGMDNLDEFNKSMKVVSETLFGSQDYAIIARK